MSQQAAMIERLREIWKDPVWSKVISVGIIAAIAFGYSLAAKYFPSLPLAGAIGFVTGILNWQLSLPLWLLGLLLTPIVALIILVVRKYWSTPNFLTDYFTIAEVARELKVSADQIYRWGETGKVICAFIRHSPGNYDDVRYDKDENGDDIKITKEHRTILSISNESRPPIEIAYLHPDDAARIIQNNIDNRTIVIHNIYKTSALNPKEGTRLVNCPEPVRKEQLIITKEELIRFQKENETALRQERKRTERFQAGT